MGMEQQETGENYIKNIFILFTLCRYYCVDKTRMKWKRHVTRVGGQNENVYRVLFGRPE
jgi:hypothetical protein